MILSGISHKEDTKQRILTIAAVLLSVIYFFVAAGRFSGSVFGIYFSTGYDAFKLIPLPWLFWIYYRYKYDERPWNAPALLVSFITLFLITLVAGVASPDSWQALADSLEILFYIGLFVMLVDFPWNERLLKIVAAGFLIGNLYLISVVFQQYFSADYTSGLIRVSGTFTHPNTLGPYCIFGMTLLLWLAGNLRNRTDLIWTWICIGGLFVALLLCQSRTTLIGLVVWLGVVYWYGNPRARKIIIGFVVLAFVLSLLLTPQVYGRFFSLFGEIQESSGVNRILIWSGIMQSEMPTLSPFGVGMGPVATVRFGDWIASSPEGPPLARAWGSHNAYLAWLVGTGLMGMCCLLWLFSSALRRLRDCDQYNKGILSAGIIALLVICLYQDPLLSSNIPIVWITMLAIIDRIMIDREKGENLE